MLLVGPSEGIRTPGILVPNQARYQLRYTRISRWKAKVLYRIGMRRASHFSIDVSTGLCYHLERPKGVKKTMRMRKRHNLEPRMERCADLMIAAPEESKGNWRSLYPGCRNLLLELGCGKGRFTAETARLQPEDLLIAVERVPAAMIIAMERVKRAELQNVRFIDADAAGLGEMFAEGEVDRIFINFCDPWPKSRDARLRLTAPAFLRSYCDLLPKGGEICFKTDNKPLFDWSVEQFKKEKWDLRELTNDLHENGPVGVMTDYEAKFTAAGMKINRLVAVKTADTLGTAAGPVPRLKNASLVDARGHLESVAAFAAREGK